MSALDTQVKENTASIQILIDAAQKLSQIPAINPNIIADGDLFLLEILSTGQTVSVTKSQLVDILSSSNTAGILEIIAGDGINVNSTDSQKPIVSGAIAEGYTETGTLSGGDLAIVLGIATGINVNYNQTRNTFELEMTNEEILAATGKVLVNKDYIEYKAITLDQDQKPFINRETAQWDGVDDAWVSRRNRKGQGVYEMDYTFGPIGYASVASGEVQINNAEPSFSDSISFSIIDLAGNDNRGFLSYIRVGDEILLRPWDLSDFRVYSYLVLEIKGTGLYGVRPNGRNGYLVEDERLAVDIRINNQGIKNDLIYVGNNTGALITMGTPIRLSGGKTSGLNNIALSFADTKLNSRTDGFAFTDIAIGGSGTIASKGFIKDIDTSSFSSGDMLYISDVTPGLLTSTQPSPIARLVAKVTEASATGELFILCQELL